MVELDTRIPSQISDTKIASFNDQMYNALATKKMAMENASAKRQMEAEDASDQSAQQLNAMFKESGGDLEKMRQNPNLDMNTAMQLDEMSSKRGKSQADAQKAQVETFAKQLEVGSMLLSGARDQASYNDALQRMKDLGMDSSRFNPEYDPQTVKGYIDQALTAKEKIDIDLRQQSNDLSERRADISERRLSNVEGGGGMAPQDKGWEVKETANGLVRVNKYTGDVMPVTMEGQMLQGKQAASVSAVDRKMQQEARVADKDYQNSLDAAAQAQSLLDSATGSGLGRARDQAYAMFGESTEGAQAAAQLKVIAGKLVAAVPKFSGPQSDADVKLYREMAGQVGDESLPVETRRAALSTVMELQRGEAERRKVMLEGGAPQQPPQPAAENIDDLLEMYK